VSQFYLYDDARARAFEPFALSRPVGELRAGALLIRQRWEQLLGLGCGGFLGALHLADFEEFDAPRAVADGSLPAGALVVNARCVPALGGGRWTRKTIRAMHPDGSSSSAWRVFGRRLAAA
jgi:hypothetical protein